MTTILKLKRGSLSKLRQIMQNPYLRLAYGEPYFSHDLKSLFISDGTNIYRIGSVLVGSFNDMTMYEEKGTLYFVTDTVRYKNTMWCHNGTSWFMVGSSGGEADAYMATKIYSSLSRGDYVVGAWAGIDDHFFGLNATDAKNLNIQDNVVTLTDISNISYVSQCNVNNRQLISCFTKEESGNYNVYIQQWKLNPLREVTQEFAWTPLTAAGPANCSFDPITNTVLIAYPIANGSDQKLVYRMGRFSDESSTWYDYTGSNTFNNVSGQYQILACDGSFSCVVTENNNVVAFLILTENGTIQELNKVNITTSGYRSNVSAAYDPIHHKIVYSVQNTQYNNGTYSFINIDGTTLSSGTDGNFCSSIPQEYYINYNKYNHSIALFFRTDNSSIQYCDLTQNAVSYEVNYIISVHSNNNINKFNGFNINNSIIYIIVNNDGHLFYNIGRVTSSGFTLLISETLPTNTNIVKTLNYNVEYWNTLVSFCSTQSIKYYIMGYNKTTNEKIPVQQLLIPLGVAMEDGTANSEILVKLFDHYQNPENKFSCGTFYIQNNTDYIFSPMKYNEMGFSEVCAISKNYILKIR